jgi:integrase
MARNINRLIARKVTSLLQKLDRGDLKLADRRLWPDGNNGYLNLRDGRCAWAFISRWQGKRFEISFGSPRNVPLARFRELVKDANAKLAVGLKPTSPKHAGSALFGECADRMIEAMKPAWRNQKHEKQWEMTLRVYAARLRPLPVDKITTDDVLSVLKPIWNSKCETARRLRGRIERVLDAAKAQGLRSGENPARWRGHLDQLLAKRQRLTRGHHAAMPYADVPAFMAKLRTRDARGALALAFAIFCSARSGEALGARWDEFDLDEALWTIPPGRMKGGVEHVVPLSPGALAIVKQMLERRSGDFVFPGDKPGRPLCKTAFEMLLRRMKIAGATAHGFRSAFRDWAGDRTNHPRDVVEAALAHVIENKAEAAYRRSTAIEKRRALMNDWAAYLAGFSPAACPMANDNSPAPREVQE